MHLQYMTYMTHPSTRTPGPGDIKFTIKVELSLVIITIHLIHTIELCPEV